jgi:putative nucleotidyltransferase with HDIG domain
MEMAKVIRDPVHKDVFLTGLEMKIIDTSIFQRLRRIKQLGVTNLVYPSANHTRFEHSIGAAHIAGRIAERLELGEDCEVLRMAGLLHDLGHGPLSHTSEELLERYLNHSHEDITLRLIKSGEIGDLLSNSTIDSGEVVSVLSKKTDLSGLISGDVDVDRMDYLARDAYHTGVAYGVIDVDRLVNTLDLAGEKLVVTTRGLRAVEGLLVARFLMTPTVYLHRTSRIVDAMFLRATEKAIETGILELDRLHQMDDVDVQCLFRCAMGYVKDMGRRIDERRLFKTAWHRGGEEMSDEENSAFLKVMSDVKRWNKIELELAQDAGVEAGYVILDIPPKPKYEEKNALVYDGENIERLDKVSPLVKILQKTQKAHWSVGVYTPSEHLEKVAKVCEEIDGYL